MAPRKATLRAPMSKKAGQPVHEIPVTPRVRRRQKTATAAMRKDTAVFQTSEDPRARWPASRPKYHKR